MKKLLVTALLAALFIPAQIMAGGLVTNTNQSASFIRKPVQDAVIDVTGTYYNPAGLAFLENGFHLSLNNQSVSQTRTINSTFPVWESKDFEGTVSAPLFPTVYAVYKTGNLALSLGFNPIGGGGSANFESGLPSFEQRVAVLPGMMTAQGIATSEYSMDAAFNASSIYWGFQINGSYAVNDVLSFSVGLRYVMANNTYEGNLSRIMVNPNMQAFGANYNGTNMVLASAFFTDAAATLTGWNIGSVQYAGALQNLINLNAANALVNLSDATTVGLEATQITQIQGLLMAAGQNPADIATMNLITAKTILDIAAPGFAENAVAMNAYANETSDKKLEATQSGSGISPIVGMNIKFNDDLNFAVKYEHKASITLTNSTTIDDVNMFPNNAEVAADMPSLLSMGLSYRATPALRLSTGFHYYFDKNADYGKSLPNDQIIDKNFWEAAAGLEYSLTRDLLVSAGYLRTQTGVNDKYHSDMSHSLSTNSIGAGLKYMITPNIGVNAGFMTTMYEGYTKAFSVQTISYDETYNRKAMTFAIGVDFKL
jgi:long-chain fatty acid transport protein